MSKKIKIAEFRKAIRLVNWIRDDFSGHVEFERLRTNLRDKYERRTISLKELIPLVGKRFTADLEEAEWALNKAEEQILRNEEAQREAIKQGYTDGVYNPDQLKAA
jgi:hypothetical protein